MSLLRFSPSFCIKNGIFTRTLAMSQAKPSESSPVKEAVKELRRRTGYSFLHIKKALEKHNFDINESEKWLKAEAKRLGWEKATGLAARVSKQGLIGILESENGVTMVELNCETDFVAKNKRFHNLLAAACHSFNESRSCSTRVKKHKWSEFNVTASEAGSKLADLIASEVGHIGENIQLRRSFFWPKPTRENSELVFVTHPVSTMTAVVDTDKGPLNVGKYAAVVETRKVPEKTPVEEEIEQLPLKVAGQQLAQHIIGMNPDKIRPIGADDEIQANSLTDERALINQTFILDEDITVGEFFDEQAIEVVDFARLEVGEQTGDAANDSGSFNA